MSWSSSKIIVLKIKGPKNFLIKLEVEPENRINFFNILQDFLSFCNSIDKTIKIEDEITDSETREICALTIVINYSQQVESKLAAISNDLLRFSRKL